MSKTTSATFNINLPATSLESGEKIIFKLHLDGISGSISGNFTASLGEGSLAIASNAASTGYNSTPISFFDSASIAIGTNTDEVILSTGVSGFHGGGYIFVPNPSVGTENSLYNGTVNYGDVDYPFVVKSSDILIVYLSDGTYFEARILSVYTSSSKIHIKLNTDLSAVLRNDLANQTYSRFLILSRQEDETNVILNFIKRDGKTSYGFLIPDDLSQTVLANIDTITKEVKQKLLNDQSVISDLNGGNF